MIQKGDTIVLGISGGADSVCLLFVLLELRNEYELNLCAVHVNHNLRGGDALRDQKYVEHMCEEYQIPCTVVSADVMAESKKRKRSLEETGREIRQEAFVSVANKILKERKVDPETIKISTAHHSNDNAETMLMNLVRGTGITGMTGIAPRVGKRIRPLLGVSRKEIEQYLLEKNILYCIDVTNNENIYTRNILRNEVIPCLEERVNEKAVVHMNQTIAELEQLEEYMLVQIEHCYHDCVEKQEACNTQGVSIDINAEKYKAYMPIMQSRLLKRCLEQVAGAKRDICRIHIEQLAELFAKQVGRTVHLPYSICAKRTYKGIRLSRRVDVNNKVISEVSLEIPGQVELADGSVLFTQILKKDELSQIEDNHYTKYFDYDIIIGLLSLRKRNSGDQIVINTKGNKQLLKKYYITNKIPEECRDEIPLLVLGSEVLWIIGYRKSSGYEITKNTKNVLRVRVDGGKYGRIS